MDDALLLSQQERNGVMGALKRCILSDDGAFLKKCQVQTSISYEIATLDALIRTDRIAIAL
jgi:hypothetical protein